MAILNPWKSGNKYLLQILMGGLDGTTASFTLDKIEHFTEDSLRVLDWPVNKGEKRMLDTPCMMITTDDIYIMIVGRKANHTFEMKCTRTPNMFTNAVDILKRLGCVFATTLPKKVGCGRGWTEGHRYTCHITSYPDMT